MRNTGPRWCGDTVLKCPRLLPKLLPPPLLATLCLALAASPLAQAQDATSMTLHEGPSKTATPTAAPEKPTLEQRTGNVSLDKTATNAFRQWRFKPGTVSKVRVPITYTE